MNWPGKPSSSSARRRSVSVALVAVLGAAAVALPAVAQQGGSQTVRLAYSGFGAERIKTVPIAKKAGAKTRVAMSLPPGDVGPVGRNDAVWAGAEIEVSVTCLEPMPQCVGKIYRYSPYIRVQLVLADGADATGNANTIPISEPERMRCSQELPNRNHHCVIPVEGMRQLKSTDNLPCGSCNVNLLVDAYHPAAKDGNVVVVGSDDDRSIRQNKGMLDAAVFDPGPPPATQTATTERPSTGNLAIGGPGGNGPKKVIYSQRLNELRAGEQLIIEAKAVEKIGHLPYNVLMQSQLVLSEKAGSVSRRGVARKVASVNGAITAQNGFNCTQGPSGHSDACVIRKIGVLNIVKNARTKPDRDVGPFVPLFVNLVVQNRAVFGGPYHSGDAARIARGAGFLEVRRYGPEFKR